MGYFNFDDIYNIQGYICDISNNINIIQNTTLCGKLKLLTNLNWRKTILRKVTYILYKIFFNLFLVLLLYLVYVILVSFILESVIRSSYKYYYYFYDFQLEEKGSRKSHTYKKCGQKVRVNVSGILELRTRTSCQIKPKQTDKQK